jgi:hypothetical protein
VGGCGGWTIFCRRFNTLFPTRLRIYKIAPPPQTKTPVKTTFSYFVNAVNYLGGKGWAAGAALPAVSTCPAQRRHPAHQQGCGGPLKTTTSYPVLIHLRRGGSHDSPPQAQRGNSGRKNAFSPRTELELMQMGSSVRKRFLVALKIISFSNLN